MFNLDKIFKIISLCCRNFVVLAGLLVAGCNFWSNSKTTNGGLNCNYPQKGGHTMDKGELICDRCRHKISEGQMTNIIPQKRIGRIFLISGPSGVGKSTVSDRLIKLFSGRLQRIVTVTTRSPRLGEINGVDYYFFKEEEFLKYIEEKKFLEWANIHQKYYYGTPLDPVLINKENGIDSLLVIDVQGMAKIRENFPDLARDMVTIFIKPKNLEELRERLKLRGTENSEKIERRLKSAVPEIEAAGSYEHIIISGTKDEDFEAVSKYFENPLSMQQPLLQPQFHDPKLPARKKKGRSPAKNARRRNSKNSRNSRSFGKKVGKNRASTKKIAPKRKADYEEKSNGNEEKSKIGNPKAADINIPELPMEKQKFRRPRGKPKNQTNSKKSKKIRTPRKKKPLVVDVIPTLPGT